MKQQQKVTVPKKEDFAFESNDFLLAYQPSKMRMYEKKPAQSKFHLKDNQGFTLSGTFLCKVDLWMYAAVKRLA